MDTFDGFSKQCLNPHSQPNGTIYKSTKTLPI